MMVHLAQPTLRILPAGGHDADVVDALAAARFDVEAEAGYHHSLPVLRIRPSRLLSPFSQCIRGLSARVAMIV